MPVNINLGFDSSQPPQYPPQAPSLFGSAIGNTIAAGMSSARQPGVGGFMSAIANPGPVLAQDYQNQQAAKLNAFYTSQEPQVHAAYQAMHAEDYNLADQLINQLKGTALKSGFDPNAVFGNLDAMLQTQQKFNIQRGMQGQNVATPEGQNWLATHAATPEAAGNVLGDVGTFQANQGAAAYHQAQAANQAEATRQLTQQGPSNLLQNQNQAALTGAQVGTEGARQGELGAQAGYYGALGGQTRAKTEEQNLTNQTLRDKGYLPPTPTMQLGGNTTQANQLMMQHSQDIQNFGKSLYEGVPNKIGGKSPMPFATAQQQASQLVTQAANLEQATGIPQDYPLVFPGTPKRVKNVATGQEQDQEGAPQYVTVKGRAEYDKFMQQMNQPSQPVATQPNRVNTQPAGPPLPPPPPDITPQGKAPPIQRTNPQALTAGGEPAYTGNLSQYVQQLSQQTQSTVAQMRNRGASQEAINAYVQRQGQTLAPYIARLRGGGR